MELIQKVSESLLTFAGRFGMFAIPLAILVSAALLLFAKYSYKFFKVVLPTAAGVLVGTFAADMFAPTLAASFPGMEKVLDPYIIAVVLISVFVAILCAKLHTLTILIIGAGVGYTALSFLMHKLLRSTVFVKRLLWLLPMSDAALFSTIVSVVSAMIALLLFKRCFKTVYIVSTSIAGAVAALGIFSIFVFSMTPFALVATEVAIAVGLLIGIVFCEKQFVDTVY